jgi:hypothetical protein
MNNSQQTKGISISHLIGKSILWFTLTLTIGLCQVWINLLLIYAEGSALKPMLDRLILEGVFLFFSIVLTVSLLIDHYLFGKTSPNFFINFIFSYLPWVVIIMPCVALYVKFYEREHLENIFPLMWSEGWLLLLTAIYAISIKFFHFMKEERIVVAETKSVGNPPILNETIKSEAALT